MSRPARCFPHPLNPPGDFPFDMLATTYDAMICSGVYGVPQFPAVPLPVLRPIFRWIWFRMKKGMPIEGVSIEEARAIKAAVKIPVLNTGGYQTASSCARASSRAPSTAWRSHAR